MFGNCLCQKFLKYQDCTLTLPGLHELSVPRWVWPLYPQLMSDLHLGIAANPALTDTWRGWWSSYKHQKSAIIKKFFQIDVFKCCFLLECFRFKDSLHKLRHLLSSLVIYCQHVKTCAKNALPNKTDMCYELEQTSKSSAWRTWADKGHVKHVLPSSMTRSLHVQLPVDNINYEESWKWFKKCQLNSTGLWKHTILFNVSTNIFTR